MDITFLGTGNAQATACYNTCFLIRDDARRLLVDAGGGNTILNRLAQAGEDWRDVRDIIVTHKHIDHLLGVVWLMRMICQGAQRGTYEGEARLYAHDEVIGLLEQMAHALLGEKAASQLGRALHLVTVADGETHGIIGHDATFFDIRSTKAKQFGFTLDLGAGRRLTCCGDEPYNECERAYAEGAAWLLHEAFCLHSQADIFRPYEKSHSTVKDACELAERLGVENLVLYHTEDKTIERRRELYTEEGSAYFHGNLFVPDDLETLEL